MSEYRNEIGKYMGKYLQIYISNKILLRINLYHFKQKQK